ncbi:MAG: hypothetical protein DVB26_05300 [Verrucomicrobia bacterium]|nr:MAG: hypothetical protein DVB26_05300 [Verrucomicrobiota bacterium]
MRTTLDLEKPILEGLKSLQKKEKIPLGRIASRLLAGALTREACGSVDKPVLQWISASMQAKVNLADKDAVARAMEES